MKNEYKILKRLKRSVRTRRLEGIKFKASVYSKLDKHNSRRTRKRIKKDLMIDVERCG